MDPDEDSIVEEDFYSFLNVPKEATREEISNAYRRLSRMYHPDKHIDPEMKSNAEIMFNKTKRAYEVLSDPHKRAIYDSLGMKGLETEGWEIVQRSKTPAEIRAEYEQLAEERAERLKQQRTNPHGNITININATDLFNPYEDEYDEYDEYQGLPDVEISSMHFSQSVDFPLTQANTCTLGGQLRTQNGNGTGAIQLNWKHVFSHRAWSDIEIALGNGPVVSFKGFRTLSRRFGLNGGTVFQFTPDGIRPGLMSTLAMQIDKNSVGYITGQIGSASAMSTSIVRDTEGYRFSLSVQVGMPHSFVQFAYAKKMISQELKFKMSVKYGTFGSLIEYGAEKKISKHSTLSFTMGVGMPSGVKLKVRLTRGNQTYSFPIHLCEDVVPSAIFYGTIVPLVVYVVVKKTIVEPFIKDQNVRKLEKQRTENANRLKQSKKEAKAAQELMMATYTRIRDEEESRMGLVIIKAVYGKIEEINGTNLDNRRPSTSNNTTGNHIVDEAVIDVTVAVQCIVKDSQLILHGHSKSQLPGFFDVAIGEEKKLHIIYNYRQEPYEVTISDTEPLRLPKNSHRTLIT